eukprot:4476266-Pyramimonas_sp.AAC.1
MWTCGHVGHSSCGALMSSDLDDPVVEVRFGDNSEAKAVVKAIRRDEYGIGLQAAKGCEKRETYRTPS